jgi:hypothetical protein
MPAGQSRAVPFDRHRKRQCLEIAKSRHAGAAPSEALMPQSASFSQGLEQAKPNTV